MLWPHFGKAPQVTIVTVEDGQVKESVLKQSPEHEHGAMPRFLELLTCDCELNTHHTSSMNLTGPDFLKRKPQILETLRYGIEHFDMDKLTRIRNNKHTL